MHVDDLPNEILSIIFSHLPLPSILALESVSERWYNLAREPNIWKHLPILYFGWEHEKQDFVHVFNLFFDEHAPLLTHIKLHYINNYDILLSMLRNCANITHLELVMCILDSEIINELYKWPSLTHIHLRNCFIKSSNFISFDKFPNLESVYLSDFGLDDINFETLLQCNHLAHIQIEKIKTISDDKIQSLLNRKKDKLITLKIYGGEAVNDKTLDLISNCSRLQSLAIIRCERLTDLGLRHLSKLKTLYSLQLWNNFNFSEKALLAFFDCPWFYKLERISLSRVSNVFSSLLELIAFKYKSIKFISLYQCSVTENAFELLTGTFPEATIIST